MKQAIDEDITLDVVRAVLPQLQLAHLVAYLTLKLQRWRPSHARSWRASRSRRGAALSALEMMRFNMVGKMKWWNGSTAYQ